MIIQTHPITGQKAGTSGLRRKTRDFMAPHFLENYVQSILSGIGGAQGKRFVIGGDGRFFNTDAIQTILRMLAANSAAQAIIGQNGLLSTPAASHLIRLHQTDGGFILSASHNPGGIDADFGLKFNMPNGGPATENITNALYAETQNITQYHTLNTPDIDLAQIGQTQINDLKINIIDPVHDYAALMQSLFDFPAIHKLFTNGFTMRFDAMHAITGPYAKHILQDKLGAPAGTVINAIPLPDFGGGHPDPNPIWAHELMNIMHGDNAPDFGAASDGDGDRNMIVGRGQYITPSDSLALLAAHAHRAPAYKNGLKGVARSMPTSTAVDQVAKALGIPVHETPTGWKFFGNLLDAGKVSLCGEESAGTGSDHVREKDGLWAVLLWLNILADSQKSVATLMQDHWETYGRNYYTRHDYENVDSTIAATLMDDLRRKLPTLAGQSINGLHIKNADDYSYHDPVDQSQTTGQGIRIICENDARIILRLSGTGTQGATIRLYLEQRDTQSLDQTPADALANLIEAAETLTEIKARTGRDKPNVET